MITDNRTPWMGRDGRSLWRNEGFLFLCAGQCLSQLADAALRIVILIWIYQLTRSGMAVSLVGLAEALPFLLLGAVTGVFVDRWNRASTMAGAVLVRALILGLFLLAPEPPSLPLIVLMAVGMSAASQFFQPAASAALPVVTGPARVGQANSLLALLTSGLAVLTPGPAALLFATAGAQRTLLALGGMYVLAVPLLLRVPAGGRQRHEDRPPSFRVELRAGWDYVRRSPLLRVILVVRCLTMLGIGALSVLDIVFVTRALHQRSEVVGLLFVAMGAGEAMGSVLVFVGHDWLQQRYHRLLGLAVLANGVCNLAYAGAPTLLIAAALLGGVGLSLPAITVAAATLLQRGTDDSVMGRVVSVIGTAASVAMITSTACGGVLADLLGVRPAIGLAAVVLIIAALIACAFLWMLPMVGPGYSDDTRPTTRDDV